MTFWEQLLSTLPAKSSDIWSSKSNILIDGQGRACLADFSTSNIKVHSRTVHPSLEGHGSTGTIRWMSPEAILGVSTYETDIWSFGMTMYEVGLEGPVIHVEEPLY